MESGGRNEIIGLVRSCNYYVKSLRLTVGEIEKITCKTIIITIKTRLNYIRKKIYTPFLATKCIHEKYILVTVTHHRG